MNAIVEAKGLGKSFGSFQALKNVSFSLPLGRIVGVIGSNGAGKTTLLNAVLGLTKYDGYLTVLGRDPSKDRAKLMEEVCFISDVAILPRWMKVFEVIDFVEGVHSKFDRKKVMGFMNKTKIPLNKKVKALSKGMLTQLHLALVMSIDAKLLVLDEPTLGLDIIFRKSFYSSLLEDFFDHGRTIIITTHQVEEIEHILSDVMFIRDGEMILFEDMDGLGKRFSELTCDASNVEAARALSPLSEKGLIGHSSFIYEGTSKDELKKLGDVSMVGLADIFVAKMTGGQT